MAKKESYEWRQDNKEKGTQHKDINQIGLICTQSMNGTENIVLLSFVLELLC